MDAQTAFERRARVQFLDVRTPREWQRGHIAGARHIPVDHLPGRLDELDRDRPVVVVCQVGLRSDMAAHYMRALGFEAHNLEGGLDAWVDSGLPVCDATGAPGRIIDPEWPPITPCEEEDAQPAGIGN
ncbi:MAG: hypothetical protein QOF51_57 [Chloroflexota bacterium]|jgi:queuine tRNA-ribosyltransferase|nr:hypothetical protein [Chloroflexota bacterium]